MSKRRSSGARFVLAIAALPAFAAAVTVTGCKKPDGAKTELTAAKQEAVLRVQTAAVIERPMPEHLVLTGTLRASQESEVAADALGKVKATYVERGQIVRAGDMLALLDARGASLSAQAASAQSNLARAQLDQAQKECQRVKALRDTGAISQAEYDRATSQCETTQWSVAAAKAQADSAQKTLGDTVIRAPFSGLVGERYVNVGQYVQPNTRVVSLYSPDPLRLELTVPEASIGGIKQELPVTFSVASYGDEVFKGTVKLISPNVRAQTRDLVIEAFCPNPDGRLKPGMFAVAKLEAGEKPTAAVPAAALKTDAESSRVFVVVDKQLQERVVQTGSERDGLVAIPVGLKAGEVVVLSPSADARDGARVQ